MFRNFSLFRNRMFIALLGSLLFHAVLLGSLGLIRSSSPDIAAKGSPSLIVSLYEADRRESGEGSADSGKAPEASEETANETPAAPFREEQDRSIDPVAEPVRDNGPEDVIPQDIPPGKEADEPLRKSAESADAPSSPMNETSVAAAAESLSPGEGTDGMAGTMGEELPSPGNPLAGPTFETLSRGLDLPVPEYPPPARKWGYQGVVRVSMTIDADGELAHVEILESSGYDILDREVLRTIKKKWFFNPPGKTVVLEKLFEFRLE